MVDGGENYRTTEAEAMHLASAHFGPFSMSNALARTYSLPKVATWGFSPLSIPDSRLFL